VLAFRNESFIDDDSPLQLAINKTGKEPETGIVELSEDDVAILDDDKLNDLTGERT